ncbi:MAG TPA: VWA domain-containing protein [Thermoanaerobaculia bacterium]
MRIRSAPFDALPPLWIAALLLSTPGSTKAQDRPQAAFGETVEVRVVNIEVVVTDRDGTPVSGLVKEDFELRVDGRPVAITNFYASERRVPRPEEAPAPAAGQEGASPAAPAAPPIRLVVWIDDLSLAPGNRRRVLRQLGEFLDEQERLGSEILIVRFDRSIEVVRPFAERRRRISDDLAELERRAASGAFLEAGRREMMREIRQIRAEDGCGGIDRMEDVARRFAAPLRGDVLTGLAGLRDWVRSLAGLEGRKALLYVSDGVPTAPGQEAYLLIDQLCSGSTSWSTTENVINQVRDVAAAANSAGVTFYTLDAAGLPVSASAGDTGAGLDLGFEQLVRANYQDSLASLANETGGRALFDSNKIAPLVSTLASDLEAYYSLGYAPEGEPGGAARRRIEVRVARAGLRVRHRTGLVDRPAVERASDRLHAALRFAAAVPDSLGATLETAAVEPIDAATARVPMQVLVPATRLVFLPGDAGETARLEIAVVASDGEGRLAPEQRRTIVVPRAGLGADLAQAIVRVPLELVLRKGRATIAVAVRDAGGSNESIVRREVLVR